MGISAFGLLAIQAVVAGGGPELPLASSPPADARWSQLPWDQLDTLAVLGGGPMWSEPPFYRVSDAVLDNDRNIVFMANGGDGEVIRYDIGSGSIERIGRRGRGPGEFRRPVWMEPHGPDSLLVYDRDLNLFSVFSRSGRFGRSFRVTGTGLGGRQAAALTRMGTRTWVGVQSGLPPVLLVPETPPGTKERDTLTVFEIDDEGAANDTIARVPYALWERLPDTTSFSILRDEDAGAAEIAAGGGRLLVAVLGDSLEVFLHRVGDTGAERARSPFMPAGMPWREVSQVFASREGAVWVGERAPTDGSTVFHVFAATSDAWSRRGTLVLDGNLRVLDASQDRVVFLHLDELGQETVVVARASGNDSS
ncbi:MAG: hypothetical protein OXH49_13325 [Gemmatimonadetes bacterium]|nr:hypothetical protein [Gemmatimonadota bacterium]